MLVIWIYSHPSLLLIVIFYSRFVLKKFKGLPGARGASDGRIRFDFDGTIFRRVVERAGKYAVIERSVQPFRLEQSSRLEQFSRGAPSGGIRGRGISRGISREIGGGGISGSGIFNGGPYRSRCRTGCMSGSGSRGDSSSRGTGGVRGRLSGPGGFRRRNGRLIQKIVR